MGRNGRKLSWKVGNCEKTKGNLSTVKEGIVKYVASDDEISDIWIKCRKARLGYDKRRTTTEPFMGIVYGVNFEISVEALQDD